MYITFYARLLANGACARLFANVAARSLVYLRTCPRVRPSTCQRARARAALRDQRQAELRLTMFTNFCSKPSSLSAHVHLPARPLARTPNYLATRPRVCLSNCQRARVCSLRICPLTPTCLRARLRERLTICQRARARAHKVDAVCGVNGMRSMRARLVNIH